MTMQYRTLASEPPAQPYTTALSAKDNNTSKTPCEDYIRQLCRYLEVSLPLEGQPFSPTKRRKSIGTDILLSIRYLYFRNPEALDEACQEYKEQSRSNWSNNTKMLALSNCLKDPVYIMKHTISPDRKKTPISTRTVTFEDDDEDLFVTPPELSSPTSAGPTLDASKVQQILSDLTDLSTTPDPAVTKAMTRSPPVKRNLKDYFTASCSSRSGPSTRNVSFTSTNPQSEPTTAQTSFSSDITDTSLIIPDTDKPMQDNGISGTMITNERGTRDGLFGVTEKFSDTNIASIASADSNSKRRYKADCEMADRRQKVALSRGNSCTCNLCRKGCLPSPARKIPKSLEESQPQWQIKHLPRHGFGNRYQFVTSGRFELVVERARIAQSFYDRSEELTNTHLRQIMELNSVPAMRTLIEKHGLDLNLSAREAWGEARKNESTKEMSIKFSGRIELNRRNEGPLFETILHPLRKERTCKLQRKYGWDRIFYLNVCALDSSSLPSHLNGARHEAHLKRFFLGWLMAAHTLLGRQWRAFHIEPIKAGSNKKKKAEVRNTHRVILFAISGEGIETVNFVDFMQSILPLKENLDQPLCKSFARIALSVSATIPSISFLPEEVEYVADRMPTQDQEDHDFDDSTLSFDDKPQQKAMDDGCGILSVAAAKEIVNSLELKNRPTVFQARINGAKGLFFITAPYDTKDEEQQKRWIHIGEQMQKYKVRAADRQANTCEKDIYSFDVVKTNFAARSAVLHRDFLQILVDRGVSKETIGDYVRENIQADTSELLDALYEPELLCYWISQRFNESEDLLKIPESGMPVAAETTARLLLESGFKPLKCKLLAETVTRMAEQYLSWMREDMRISCPKSTTVMGIADPFGVLKPGEIHLAFSNSFEDKNTHETWAYLNKINALVSRSPTLRYCDIQKVKVVHKPELAHLTDVVVFPSIGQIPLASKLQGGDYDGDTFWVCWEPRFVEPFKNAPVPEVFLPKYFGIVEEKTRLRDIQNIDRIDSEMVDDWLRVAFAFMLKEDVLGRVTNYYEALSYVRNSLWTSCVLDVADLHTHLIDAKKNGLSFSKEDFDSWLAENGLPSVRDLQSHKPIIRLDYPEHSSHDTRDRGLGMLKKRDRVRDLIKRHQGKQPKNILDYVLVMAIDPAISKALDDVGKALNPPAHDWRDPELEWGFDEATRRVSCAQSYPSDDERVATLKAVDTELVLLSKELDKIKRFWSDRMNYGFAKGGDIMERSRRECLEKMKSIMPQNPDQLLVIDDWTKPSSLPNAPTMWDVIKASTLAKWHWERFDFLFATAGKTLCQIKVSHQDNVAQVASIAAIKKIRRPKPASRLDENFNDHYGSDDYELTEFEDSYINSLDDSDFLAFDDV